jgi:hypothetical protein
LAHAHPVTGSGSSRLATTTSCTLDRNIPIRELQCLKLQSPTSLALRSLQYFLRRTRFLFTLLHSCFSDRKSSRFPPSLQYTFITSAPYVFFNLELSASIVFFAHPLFSILSRSYPRRLDYTRLFIYLLLPHPGLLASTSLQWLSSYPPPLSVCMLVQIRRGRVGSERASCLGRIRYSDVPGCRSRCHGLEMVPAFQFTAFTGSSEEDQFNFLGHLSNDTHENRLLHVVLVPYLQPRHVN